MKEYISTIIYICIFSVILELILPDNKLKKYVNVLASLIVIMTLISPVVNVLNNNDVVEVISSTLDNIQDKTEVKEYNVSNIENRIIYSSVKEKLEEDIYTKCKQKWDKYFNIKKVEINLNKEYKLEEIQIYVCKISEVTSSAKLIDYISKEYEVNPRTIKVIKEE